MKSSNTAKSILKLIVVSQILLFQLANCETILDKSLSSDDQVCKLVKEKLVCTRVSSVCPESACLKLKEVTYDLDVLDSNAFSNYKIDDTLTINFNNLNRIQTDAFNGFTLNENASLNVNIVYEANLISSNSSTVDSASTSSAKSNLVLDTNAFRHMLVGTNAKLSIHIKNYDLVEFKFDAILNQIEQASQSLILVNVETSKHVVFRGGSAASNSKLVSDSNSIPSQFKINIAKCSEIAFDKESFSNYKQTSFSLFQLVANEFDNCRLGRLSFSQISQSEASYFELSLTGKRLTLSEQAFSGLKQNLNSKFVLYFKISESSVCLKANTFGDVTQAFNSTLRVSFNLREQNDLVFKRDSIRNFYQGIGAQFQMYVLQPSEVRLESQSVTNLIQDQSSSLELWISKANSNFVIEQNAFNKTKQARDAVIKFGYQSSEGYFYQSPNAFLNLVGDLSSQIVYDISPGTNFNLRFSPRPMPRIMPLMTNNMSIEEAIYRMFPNLGRQSRPDQISLNDYKLESEDFCRVSEIPFDVLVKLRPDTECSCSVYYLYRLVRRIRNNSDWIQFTPECYQNKLKQLGVNSKGDGLNEQKDLKSLEDLCKFRDMVNSCRLAAANTKPIESVNGSSLKDCDASFEYFESDQVNTNDESYVYDIGSETDTIIEDGEDESQEDDDDPKSEDKNDNSIYSKFSYDDDKIEYGEVSTDEDDDTSDIYDLDDEEGDSDDYVDTDSKDSKLVRPIHIEQETVSHENQNKVKIGYKLSLIHIMFILILSTILVAILIAVFVVFRINKREQSVSQNEDNEDSDDDDDEDGEDSDEYNDNDNKDLVPNRKSNRSLFEQFKGKFTSYTHSNKKNKPRLPSMNAKENESLSNKSLVVQCDRKNSVTSSLTSSIDYVQNNISSDNSAEDEKLKNILITNLIVSEQNESNSANCNNNRKEKRIYNSRLTNLESKDSNENNQSSHDYLDAKIKQNYDVHN